jgi:hypothetical protein
MRELGKLEDIYINTKICIPETYDPCDRPEDLWNFTYLKLPDNSYEQLFFNGKSYHTNSVKKFNVKCFSGEPLQRRIFSRGKK